MATINSRAKGASAERELIKDLQEHLGDEIAGRMKRNLEQSRKGGHDIAGLPGWALEVKRYKRLSTADVDRFWGKQVVPQAIRIRARPALAYRGNFQPWRFRLPMHILTAPHGDWVNEWACEANWTAEVGIEVFAWVVREQHCADVLQKVSVESTILV